MRQSNNKTVWIVTGIVSFLFCSGIGVMAFLLISRSSSQASAKQACEQMMTQIARPWNGKAILSVSDPYDAQPMTLEQADKLAASLNKEFGSLMSVTGEINDMTDRMDYAGEQTDVEFLGAGIFEKGPGDVMIIATKRQGRWYLSKFDVFGPNTPRSGHNP